jgi:hypothetical protein
MGETNKPARDYKMFNKENGLTTTMLDIGTTSFTFSVEWQLDTEIPTGTLYLFGNRHMEDSWWSWMCELVLEPTIIRYDNGLTPYPREYDLIQRKATFEIPYDVLPKEYNDFKNAEFAGKGLFHVGVPPADDTGWLPSREEMEVELAKIKEEEKERRKKQLEMWKKESEENRAAASPPSRNHLWLYLAILPLAFAVLYFVRRKLKPGN